MNQSPLARGTLGRQLVTRVVALLAGLAVLMGLLSALFIHATMVSALDATLADQTRRLYDLGAGKGDHDDAQHIGREVGSISVVQDATGRLTAFQIVDDVDNPVVTLTQADVTTLLGQPQDNRARTVTLLTGSYRVMAGTSRPADGSQPPPSRTSRTQPTLVVAALPMSSIYAQIGRVVGLEAALALIGSLLSLLLVRSMVQEALRPLLRLTSAAGEVADLELDRGDVELAVRVPEEGDEVAEVARLGHSFNRMLDHVEESLTARQASETKVRQFVADASHELRNPLASIRGYAEITRRERDQLPPDTQFAMGRIEAESARMSALVEDMLLLARLDNSPRLTLGDVDLTELVVMTVSDARAAGPDHQWSLALPPEPVVARADQARLQQVVVNLLTNARVHTPTGTHVRVSVREVDGWAELVVANDGPVIPAEMQASIFERFVRADPSRQRQSDSRSGSSTGLGLAIARSVLAAHGGTITVSSEPGDTRFTVRVPLAQRA